MEWGGESFLSSTDPLSKWSSSLNSKFFLLYRENPCCSITQSRRFQENLIPMLRMLCCGCAAAAVGGFEDNIPEERVVCHPPASPTSKGTSWNQNLEYEFLAVEVEEEED